MELARLGRTELSISRVGLGSWAIGGDRSRIGWGPQSDYDSIATVHEAITAGINWIDTAPAYGGGHSEEVIAAAIRDLSDPPMIFTKCGRVMHKDGTVTPDLRPDSIRRECEDSLSRLGVESIELYQIHWPEPIEQLENAWATLAELKREGKVRHIGVSNCGPEELAICERIAPVESLQPPYSLIARHIEQGTLDWCAEHDTGVIAYAPMHSGLLTGKMTAERAAALPDTDWRSRHPEFRPPRLANNLELVKRLAKIGGAYDLTPGQLAVAWVLEHPAVNAVIVGARRPTQIGPLAAVGSMRLGLRAAGL